MKDNKQLLGVLLALLGYGIFSTHDALIKSMAGGPNIIEILFFVALFIFPWLSFMIMWDDTPENHVPKHPALIVLRTLAGLGSAGFVLTAFMKLPMAEVYGIIFTAPMMITLLSIFILKEEVGIHRLLAIGVGFAGVLVMLPLAGGESLSPAHLLAFLGALAASFGAIITRKIGGSERPVVLIMSQSLVTLIVMTLILPLDYKPLEISELYKLLLIGLLSFVAQLCIVFAYRFGRAGLIAPMQYSQMLWGMIIGVFVFGDIPNKRMFLGASIIVLSGLYILYRERTHRRADAIDDHTEEENRIYNPGLLRGFWVERSVEYNDEQAQPGKEEQHETN